MRSLALATVLVASDLSASSDVALETGRRLADAAGAALHVVHVRDSTSHPDGDILSPEQAQRELDNVLHCVAIPARRARIHAVAGNPADAINALSDEIRADVIVVGPPRERGTPSAHPLGGTARAIAAGANAPCLAAVRPLPLPLERVLVTTDLSESARGALLVGLSWASALRKGSTNERSTTLTALHVATEQRADESEERVALESELDMLRQSAGTWAGVAIEGLTARKSPDVARAIARCAEEQRADLVVVGTRGIGLDELQRLGSVSALVVERSPVAVLLVPASVWRRHLEA